MKIQNALGILSSEVPIGNLLWVDAVNGVDALAQRGRMTIPFRTLTAAKNAAVTAATSTDPRDTIVVLPGVYNERDLLKHRVNWHFMNGARVEYSGADNGAIFDASSSAISSVITGAGEFINSATGSSSNVLWAGTGGGDLEIHLQARRMAAQKCCIKVNVSTGIVRVDVSNDINSSGERTIQNLGTSELHVKAHHVQCSLGSAVRISAGSVHVIAHSIVSSGVSSEAAVQVTGGSGYSTIRAFQVECGYDVALRWAASAGARIGVIDARLVSSGTGAQGQGIDLQGTTGAASDMIRLHNCMLLPSASATYAMAAQNAATRVFVLGTAVGTKTHNNISIVAGTYSTETKIA